LGNFGKIGTLVAQPIQPGRFGHIGRPDDTWLAKQENELILEPELPIIDTHHHLWDRNGWTYLLPELLTDSTPATTLSPQSSRSAVRWLCHGNEGGAHREPKLAKHHVAVTALFHCAAASVRSFRSVDRETRWR
jgi:hypothetical protein